MLLLQVAILRSLPVLLSEVTILRSLFSFVFSGSFLRTCSDLILLSQLTDIVTLQAEVRYIGVDLIVTFELLLSEAIDKFN